MMLCDRPTVQVDINIDAPREVVWELITDPERMGTFSPENLGGTWDPPAASPAVGARFTSTNRWEGLEWETTSTVVECEPNRVFAFVVGSVDDPSSIWRYQMHPRKGGGTHLIESMEFGPGPSGTSARIAEVPDKEEYVIAARIAEHRANMTATLISITLAAEERAQ